MGVILGRPGGIPLTKTVWTQGELFFDTGGIGAQGAKLVGLRIPKELVYRKIYVAIGCTYTGAFAPDPATDNLDVELTGDLSISLEGTNTFRMRHYHNPQSTLLITDEEEGRSVGPWPPCGLSRPITLANVVPKLPQPTHPDCRFFTLFPRRDDAVPGPFLPLIATCFPMRNVSEGSLLQFEVKARRTAAVGGTISGHMIVAVESSSHAL